jgi:hypothetical protein
LVWPLRAPFGPYLVRIQSREHSIELVRNRVEIVGEAACVDVEGHGCRRLAEHLLHDLDVGAGGMARLAALCRSSCGVSPGSPAFFAAQPGERQ